MNSIPFNFPTTQYYQEVNSKTQIYLHHTAGNADPAGVFNFWSTNPDHIAVFATVGGKPKMSNSWIDGQIVQGFDSKYWAYHLGLKKDTFAKFGLPYKPIDKISVGIEICNYGQLSYKDGKYYTYVGSTIQPENVIELDKPHRGYKFYHKYTDAQITSVHDLLLFLQAKHNISLTYHEDIWDVNARALKGEQGVFTHNSVRFDKVDVSPQPKLIEMLKTL